MDKEMQMSQLANKVQKEMLCMMKHDENQHTIRTAYGLYAFFNPSQVF